jgi:hypothetical protein
VQRTKRSSIEDKYQSLVNGETQMQFLGSHGVTIRSAMVSAGQEPGLGDLKKTFIYNQKLTGEVFEILENHPDKDADAQTIAAKVE